MQILRGNDMRSNYKLIIRAKVMKQITEEYQFDCTGMTPDQIQEEMGRAYVEDRGAVGWECVGWETDHSEIKMKLEIVADV
jgi:hypothetical protein